jgi:peptidoglycan/xylan/chitin deacetylase (PgdA/CDA1 family)
MNPATELKDDGVVLCLFHGVVPLLSHEVRNYTGKHIALDTFEQCLRDLSSTGHPVSMQEVSDACRGRGALPPRAFAITFDDGFRNNLTVAAPVLERLAIPAAFYVTTSFIDRGASSWTDLLERAIEQAPAGRVDLPGLGAPKIFATRSEKVELLDDLRMWVKTTPSVDPLAVVEEVQRQLGIHHLESDPDLDDKLTWDDLRGLDRHPLFTVGGHGHTHRILSFLTPEDLEAELAHSIDGLAAQLSHPVTHFSYPEGLRHCYSDEVIAALRARGIVCAPTAEPGINRRCDDPFLLKRITV